MAARHALRAQCLPAALPRPVRVARPAQAGRGRSRGHLVHLREAAWRRRDGGRGWADVWMRGHFGWEYKGKHKDLKAAYQQLLLYREELDNPPLLVVCDMDRFEVHTNFTGTAKQVHLFDLAGLADPANLRHPPQALQRARIAAAGHYQREDHGRGGRALRQAGRRPEPAGHRTPAGRPLPHEAHVLHVRRGHGPAAARPVQQVAGHAPRPTRRFCPGGWNRSSRPWPKGGDYGNDAIPWFNGGLFADADVIPLTARGDQLAGRGQRQGLVECRALDLRHAFRADAGPRQAFADRRPLHQPGRHRNASQAGPAGPLAARVGGGQTEMRGGTLAQGGQGQPRREARPATAPPKDSPQRKAFDRAILDFAERLAHVTVLDRGLRLRQLPLRGDQHAPGPGEGSDYLRGQARPLARFRASTRRSFTGWRSTPTPSSLPRS